MVRSRACLVLLLAFPAMAQKVIHVDHDAPGALNGTSWFNAYRDLQQAIAVSAPGDQIWVAEGTYYPFGQGVQNPSVTQCNRTSTFSFSKTNVKVYGGFRGYVSPSEPGETSLAERAGLFQSTRLSGDIDRNSAAWIPGPGSVYEKHTVSTRALNSFTIVTYTGAATEENLLDGFTIIDGNAQIVTPSCTNPPNSPIGTTDGGGVRLIGGARPMFVNCTFARNSAAGMGGAVYIGNAAPRFIDCVFEDNAANDLGGGVALDVATSTAGFERCQFVTNAAEVAAGTNEGYGGAVAFDAAANASFQDCLFLGNLCGGNFQGSTLGGGALFTASGTATIERCVFVLNRARGVNAHAGAIFLNNNSTVNISNSVFLGNSSAFNPTGGTKNAGDGGAIRATLGCKLTIVSSTFAGNSAAGLGGAVMSEDGQANANTITIRNCILYGNSGNKAVGWGDVRDELSETGSVAPPINATHSCIRFGFAGEGNTIANPLFVSLLGPDGLPGTGDEDLRLSAGSPLIDTGNEGLLATSFDSAGNLRRLDGNKDLIRAVDHGAFEFIDPTGFRFWMDPAGGSFFDAFRWDVATPTSVNGALLGEVVTGPYTVSIGSGAVSDRLIVRGGEPTLAFTGGASYQLLSLSSAGTFLLGGDSAPHLRLEGHGRVVTKNGAIACIGPAPEDLGTLTLDGPQVLLDVGDELCVADQGTGVLRILNGARVRSKTASVGDKPGSLGGVLIDGFNSSWEVSFFLSVGNGSVRVINGGMLDVGLVGALILPGGKLTGDSIIDGDVLSIGEVSPGEGDFEDLTIEGHYSQFGSLGGGLSGAGRFRARVGFVGGSPVSDRLIVTGQATLAGGLLIERDPSYATPTLGDSFEVLEAASRVGQFDVAFLPSLSSDQYLRVDYPENDGRVTLSVQSLTELLAFLNSVGGTIDGVPAAAALGDVDPGAPAKGPDLIVAVPSNEPGEPGSVLVLFNAGTDGQGNWLEFSEALQLAAGVEPAGLAAADLDGDGAADFAVTHRADHTVTVFLSDGAGAFTTKGPYPAGLEPVGIAAADIDGDGDLDLAIASSGNDQVVVLLNDGSGGFTPAIMPPLIVGPTPVAIVAVDLDGDGDPDLVTANSGSQGPEGGGFVFNDGPGMGGLIFEPCPVPVGPRPTSVVAGKVGAESPGARLLVFTNSDAETISVILVVDKPGWPTRPVDIRPHVELPVGLHPRSVRVFDGDGDGDDDIFVIAEDAQGVARVVVLRQDSAPQGQVAFAPSDLLELGDDPKILLSGDVDLDSREDLVAVGAGGGDAPAEWASTRNNSSTLCYADCEGDKDLDLFDFLCFQQAFVNQEPYADCENDGDWDLFDFLCFQGRFVVGCP